MSRTLKERLAALPADRRGKVEARAAELIAEEMSLRELRKALGQTQAKVAADLGVGQDTVSRYEQRSDMLLSTLREYIGKMGGELVLTAQFPDRKPVRIRGFADISGRGAAVRSSPATTRARAGRVAPVRRAR
jgi:DNA-binding XRE family transcriptional regulator